MSVNFASESGFCNCGAELLTWGECEDGVCEECSSSERCIRCGRGLVSDEDIETGVCADCWDPDFDEADNE